MKTQSLILCLLLALVTLRLLINKQIYLRNIFSSYLESIPVESTISSKPVIVPPTSNSQKNLKAFSISADSDDDYIEPESPTGADALIYDDEDEEENETVPVQASIDVIDLTQDDSPPRSTFQNLPRDDYNPSKM